MEIIDTTTVRVCHACACVVSNGEGAPESEEAVENLGGWLVIMSDESDTLRRPSGCFDCFVCDEIVYEHGHVAEWSARA